MTPRRRKIPHHSAEPLITTIHDAGEVIYPDDQGLKRPLDPPAQVSSFAKKVMVAAAVIAAIILAWYVTTVVTAPEREQKSLEANLQREVPLDLPALMPLMPLDDATIVQVFKDQELNILESVPVGTSEDGSFEIIKLPADVSTEEAAAMYLRGVNSLSASEVIRLVNGSWILDVARNPTSLRIHYADFDSPDLESALKAAMAAEGLDESLTTDSGVDDVGNTYKAGIIVTDAGTYSWRVSGVPLNAVYEEAGIPANAFYIGVRFTS